MELNLTKKQITVLLSTILLTIGYYFLALYYVRNPLTPHRKDLVIFHLIFGPIFADSPWIDYWQYIYQFLMSLFLFLILPIIIIRYYFKEPYSDLKNYGFQLGEKKFNFIWTIIGFALLPIIFFTASEHTILAEYPLSKLVTQNIGVFIFYYLMYFTYYLGYEFIFRGYLQFGLKSEDTGNLGIIFILTIQTLITGLFHIGKPIFEIIPAFIIGPIFGLITLKGRSLIWPVLAFHFSLGLVIDLGAIVWSSI
ncbi:MAG: CPBP family intramembrane glutamic endopeptidase [Candidatus Helarchaeota archaeon]